MLPKRLHELRERLRGSKALSADQRGLLDELNALDRNAHTTSIITEERLEKASVRIVSGSGGGCSCCGK